MVKQMRIGIGHDGGQLPGFYGVFAGDCDCDNDGHTGDEHLPKVANIFPI